MFAADRSDTNRIILFVTGLTVLAWAGFAQEAHAPDLATLGTSTLDLTLTPSAGVPLGADGDLYGIGGSAELRGRMRLDALPALYPFVEAGYGYTPVHAETSLHVVYGGAGLAGRYDVTPRFGAVASIATGYAQAFLMPTIFTAETETGGSGYADVAAGISYTVSPLFSLGGDLSYRNTFGLLQSVEAGLFVTAHLPNRSRSAVDIVGSDLPTIYPSLAPYYAGAPPGVVRVRNVERFAVRDVSISFSLPQALSERATVRYADSIGPGEEALLPIPLLLSDTAIATEESQTVGGDLSISYSLYGEKRSVTADVPAIVTGGNAIVWDDDRKAAAFVAHRSPTVMNLASNVLSQTNDSRFGAAHANLRASMAIYAALVDHGIAYVKDPVTPYNKATREQLLEDYIRFPSQTLANRAGDCDDLAVLFCSLLESAGMQTALVTIPGHLYAAVALDLSIAEAERVFADANDLIEIDGEAWLPVEVTELDGDFLRAWSTGAAQWRRFHPQGQAELIPVHVAWNRYPPVAEPPAIRERSMFPIPQVTSSFERDMERFTLRSLEPRIESYRERLERDPDNRALRNRLAVLYARYGFLTQAERELERSLAAGRHVPSLVNLGNVQYLAERYEAAASSYTLVLAADADNAVALLGLSRAQYALGKVEDSSDYFIRLERVDPELAADFSYLATSEQSGERAASAQDQLGRMVWSDVE